MRTRSKRQTRPRRILIPILPIETQHLTKYSISLIALQTLISRLDAYYDLVRLYHPDKAAALLSTKISADEAHARFRDITAAYDALRRKTALNGPQSSAATTSMDRYQTTAAYRAMQRRRQELYDSGAVDDSRADRLLIAGIVATILFIVVHNLTTRREVIAESISRSRIIGAQTQSQRMREAEERLSMAAVDQVNNNS